MSEQTANILTATVPAALAALISELAEVEGEMHTALADLRPPFSQLVQARLRGSFPLRCAAFVLAAGGADDSQAAPQATPQATPQTSPQTSPQERQKRIDLAAAIEVLRLALAVHTQLLDAAPFSASGALDRSLLGSTVLAGDYCFSRAAALAARTDSPVVVDIFAHALQRVSEGTLRGLFPARERTGEDVGESNGASEGAGGDSLAVARELCLAGVLAAGELAGLGAAEREADRQAARLLLDAGQGRSLDAREPPPGWLAGVAATRRARWLALVEWLRAA